MHQRRLSLRRAASTVIAATAVTLSALPVRAESILGLLTELDNTGNALVTFDSAGPIPTTVMALTGLVGDTRLVGIDLRPTTGVVYGLGNAGGLYTVDPLTAAASFVGTLSVALSPAATSFGVDFNPVPDLAGMPSLRITNSAGQNLRANVNSGLVGVTVADTSLNGATSALFASAYTNNDRDPTTATALFGIGEIPNFGRFGLYRQNPANDGTLTFVGSLGLDPFSDTSVGFDVSSTGAAFASASGSFYSVDLASGAASFLTAAPTVVTSAYRLSDITALTPPVPVAVAPIPEPETYALMLAGLAGLAAVARRRKARSAVASV